MVFRVDVFNVFNHPELGSSNLNISSPATFSRIASLENTSPIDTSGARIQWALRFRLKPCRFLKVEFRLSCCNVRWSRSTAVLLKS
jgi:hypothetical protein